MNNNDAVLALTNMAQAAGWKDETIQKLNDMVFDASKKRAENIDVPEWSNESYDWSSATLSHPINRMSGGMSKVDGTTSGPMSLMSKRMEDVFGGVSPKITQRAGNRNSMYDNISGGVNRGTDFAVPSGTPLAAPGDDQWVVAEAFGDAPNKIDPRVNRGYGNSVLLRNRRTGELVRMSHLSNVAVKPGQIVRGGDMIGLSGTSGHATGPHLDAEYIDTTGKLRDILSSPYAGAFYHG